MIFGSSDAGKFIRNLENEFGEDFDDFDSQVKDSIYLHSNANESGLNKQLIDLYDDEIIISKNIIKISNTFKNPKGYILYTGIGMI